MVGPSSEALHTCPWIVGFMDTEGEDIQVILGEKLHVHHNVLLDFEVNTWKTSIIKQGADDGSLNLVHRLYFTLCTVIWFHVSRMLINHLAATRSSITETCIHEPKI